MGRGVGWSQRGDPTDMLAVLYRVDNLGDVGLVACVVAGVAYCLCVKILLWFQTFLVSQ